MGNIIEVRNLVKKFGKIIAVDDISFEVKENEIFGFLGPNGAGKTTTINIICTLISKTAGEVSLCGYDVSRERNMVRNSIGLVFQDPSLDDRLTARENLYFHALLYNIPRYDIKKRSEEVLKIVNLSKRKNDLVQTFSGGMKRRLEIARGLLHEPKVLFLDEPTLGLDPQTRRKIWEKIKELNKGNSNITILITTHYMEEADELADRICIMDHGKIIALDTSKNLKRQLSGDIIDIEFDIIKTHAQSGYDILKTIEFPWPVAQIVLQHHERIDGSGYPSGLSDGEILTEARILAVADVVEAMTSHRPYRPALGIDKALAEISRNRLDQAGAYVLMSGSSPRYAP